jgi:hypothetical protein
VAGTDQVEPESIHTEVAEPMSGELPGAPNAVKLREGAEGGLDDPKTAYWKPSRTYEK